MREALHLGYPAARVITESVQAGDANPQEVRIAFHGDAVLFSDEAERVYQAEGLAAFQKHETDKAAQPLPDGPFKPLLAALHRLQSAGEAGGTTGMRIRTALVTARSAPAHERAIRTLMDGTSMWTKPCSWVACPRANSCANSNPTFSSTTRQAM